MKSSRDVFGLAAKKYSREKEAEQSVAVG